MFFGILNKKGRKERLMEKGEIKYEFVSERGSWIDSDVSKRESSSDSAEPTLLSCVDVVKSYGEIKALRGVSLNVSRGVVIGLLGPNGSGKTTLIKLIAGLLTQDGGGISVLGSKIGVETKKKVAYLPERNSLPLHFTVGEAVRFYEDFFPDFEKERAEKILSELSVDRNKRIKTLSKGLLEKLALALVMSRRADLYILDEPISGVDPATRDYIIDTVIKNVPENASVIISTHLISDIERIMDEFVFMKYGEIYAHSTPGAIMEKYGITIDEYFREVFRC